MSKMVQIQTRPCPCCGGIKFLDVEEEHLQRYYSESRPLVQECFPELTAEQREMLISGMCPECWEDMFPPEEDEE